MDCQHPCPSDQADHIGWEETKTVNNQTPGAWPKVKQGKTGQFEESFQVLSDLKQEELFNDVWLSSGCSVCVWVFLSYSQTAHSIPNGGHSSISVMLHLLTALSSPCSLYLCHWSNLRFSITACLPSPTPSYACRFSSYYFPAAAKDIECSYNSPETGD